MLIVYFELDALLKRVLDLKMPMVYVSDQTTFEFIEEGRVGGFDLFVIEDGKSLETRNYLGQTKGKKED